MSAGGEVVAVQAKRSDVVAGPPQTPQFLVERREQIREAIDKVMVPDLHYGIIPGTKAVSLYKEGAEVLLSMFNIAVQPIVTDMCTPTEVRFQVEVRGTHMGSGNYVGSGIGVCSSNEEKYRWRKARNDREFQAADPNMRRIKYNRDYDEKQVRQSPYDAYQTIVSMAKKRAMVDLCKTALAASEVLKSLKAPAGPKPDIGKYTRETRNGNTEKDMSSGANRPTGAPAAGSDPKYTHSDRPPAAAAGGQAVPKTAAAGNAPQAGTAQPQVLLVSQDQVETLSRMIDNIGVPETEFLGQYEIGAIGELPASRFEAATSWLARMMG